MNNHLKFQLKAFFVKTGLVGENDNDGSEYIYTIPELNKHWNQSISPEDAYIAFFQSYCDCRYTYTQTRSIQYTCWDCKQTEHLHEFSMGDSLEICFLNLNFMRKKIVSSFLVCYLTRIVLTVY